MHKKTQTSSLYFHTFITKTTTTSTKHHNIKHTGGKLEHEANANANPEWWMIEWCKVIYHVVGMTNLINRWDVTWEVVNQINGSTV